jgi:hypothetical protein
MGRSRLTRAALLGLAAAGLAGAGASHSTAGSGGSGARAHVLAIAPGGIAAFAQDGPRVVWLGCTWGSLDVRRTGPPLRTRPCTKDGTVAEGVWRGGQRLVLAGGWVLHADGSGGNNWETMVYTRRLGSRHATRLDYVTLDAGDTGTFAGPVAGDGRTLLYSTISVLEATPAAPSCEENGENCPHVLGPSALYRVRNGSARRLPGVPGGVALAVSGDLVAQATAGGATLLPSHGWPFGACPCNFTPAVAPDGRLAFGSGRDGAAIALYVSDGSGGQARRITTSADGYALDPTWSPDGSRLAFDGSTEEGWESQIFVVGADGSGLRPLTLGSRPTWSPDGTQVAFTSSGTIFLIDPEGANKRAVAPGRAPTWSPDGKRLAYLAFGSVYSLDLATGVMSPLFHISQTQLAQTLEWSPDGSAFLFSAYPTGSPLPGIWIVGSDGSNPRLIGRGYSPAWTSDSRNVVFAAPAGQPQSRRLELYEMGRDGGLATRLTETATAPATAPVEIRRLSTGKLVTTFDAQGDVQALALSQRYVAAVIRDGGGARVEVRDAHSGALLRQVRAPQAAPRALALWEGPRPLSVAGRQVAFAAGRKLKLLDIRTGRVRIVAVVRGTVVGLDLQGRRLTWAETPTLGHGDAAPLTRGNGRILTLLLPKHRER